MAGPAEWGELDHGVRHLQARQAAVADRHPRRQGGGPARDQVRLQALAAQGDRQRPHDPGELRAGQLDRRRRDALRAACSSTSTSRAKRRSTASRTPWSPIWCTRAPTASSRWSRCCSTRAAPIPRSTRSGRTCRRKRRRKPPSDATVDAATLLPADQGYYTFQGSLTTPPCSEDVRWFVLKTPVKIADSEITAFGKLYPMNARPTQPLNGRTIEATR